MFWWIKRSKVLQRYDRFQEEIKRLNSLQKTEAYLEPKWASAMELFVNILNDLLFSQQKFHHRCLTGLYIGLRKYWHFQHEAKVER